MLRKLKDGQVYVSVDEVHRHLKNTGNTMTKETIQGTKCSLEYEKVKHGGKNNREGLSKAKTYYKLVDAVWKNLPNTRITPALRYNSLQLEQRVEDKSRRKTKARGKRVPNNKRKRRIIQSPSPAAQNKKPVKRESLTNKMVQLQRLYISNNGAAPLSLLQPDHIYTPSVPLPPASFQYAEKILHYILHGVRGPALAHIIGALTAKEEAASAEEVKFTGKEVKLIPEDAATMHPVIVNPNTSFQKNLILGLGLIPCPERKVSHDAYICILASDMVMKIRKPRYLSPMQQCIGNCLQTIADRLCWIICIR